jgi:hypothetical protein
MKATFTITVRYANGRAETIEGTGPNDARTLRKFHNHQERLAGMRGVQAKGTLNASTGTLGFCLVTNG